MLPLLDILCVTSLCGSGGLALFRHAFWRPLDADSAPNMNLSQWPSVDIIVPARNEADMIPQSLPTLLQQNYPGTWRVILVDDNSQDGTGALAKKLAGDIGKSDRLSLVPLREKPAGWSGKVAAMNAGYAQSHADYVLFTDADIAHPQDSLRTLVAHAATHNLALTSRMVLLHCASTAEKLMIPAFVFFFAMLYPFSAINNVRSRISGAAGGVMLIARPALDRIGGLRSIQNALIDDCSLAKAIKGTGDPIAAPQPIELALTHSIRSLRPYPVMHDLWRMVARTAFTQLHYSTPLLIGTIFGLGILFIAPLIGIMAGSLYASLAGLLAWLTLSLIYAPMIRFYRLPLIWALTLPLAACVYMGATIDSARLYWQGQGGQWKGRAQA